MSIQEMKLSLANMSNQLQDCKKVETRSYVIDQLNIELNMLTQLDDALVTIQIYKKGADEVHELVVNYVSDRHEKVIFLDILNAFREELNQYADWDRLELYLKDTSIQSYFRHLAFLLYSLSSEEVIDTRQSDQDEGFTFIRSYHEQNVLMIEFIGYMQTYLHYKSFCLARKPSQGGFNLNKSNKAPDFSGAFSLGNFYFVSKLNPYCIDFINF